MFYKKILVPVDGSEHASMACRHAIALAKSGDMSVVFLHCYDELPSVIGGSAREEVIAASEEEGKNLLCPCEASAKEAGVECKTIVRNGPPARTIVHVAEEEGCDLIAMGSRGLGNFSGMVMGSVSHRVLNHSTIPVLIVPDPAPQD